MPSRASSIVQEERTDDQCTEWRAEPTNSTAPSVAQASRYEPYGHVDLCKLRGEPSLNKTTLQEFFQKSQRDTRWQDFKGKYGASPLTSCLRRVNTARTLLRQGLR